MADSVMAVLDPAGAAHAAKTDYRTVYVQQQDGSIKPIVGVPNTKSDDEIAGKYGGRAIGIPEDMARSAWSGIAQLPGALATVVPKLSQVVERVTGLSNLHPEQWSANNQDIAKSEQAITGAIPGSDYRPLTMPGRFAGSVAPAAVPIPGLGNPILQMLLGGASGVMGQGATELGMSPLTSAAASTIPWLAYAGIKGSKPFSPYERTSNALESLTPEQRATMDTRMQVAHQNNLPLMAWQAAPEGSDLRNLGRAIAANPRGAPVRNVQTDQAFKITGITDTLPSVPSAPSRIAGPMYRENAPTPLDPTVAETIYNNLEQLKTDKFLAPKGDQAKVIDGIKAQIGHYEQMKPSEVLDQLTAQRDALPRGDPQRDAINSQIKAVYNGDVQLPKQFVPEIENFGQLQNIYQKPKFSSAEGIDLNVDQATKRWIRDAIAGPATQASPQFGAAREKWAQLSDIAKAAEATDMRSTGSNVQAAAEARVAPVPEAIYAGAVNPMWASVPLARRFGERQLFSQYNKAFTSPDIQMLIDLAQNNPHAQFGLGLVNAGLQPFRQGLLTAPDSQR